MSFDSVLLCACEGIPQTDGIVKTLADERPTIRTEGYAIDLPRVPFERVFVCACDGIPQPYSRAAPTSERPPIRTEGYATDRIRVPFESHFVRACERIPQPDGPVPAPNRRASRHPG